MVDYINRSLNLIVHIITCYYDVIITQYTYNVPSNIYSISSGVHKQVKGVSSYYNTICLTLQIMHDML